MLLALSQWLAQDARFFSVFNYITLRAVLACLTALAMRSLPAGTSALHSHAAMRRCPL